MYSAPANKAPPSSGSRIRWYCNGSHDGTRMGRSRMVTALRRSRRHARRKEPQQGSAAGPPVREPLVTQRPIDFHNSARLPFGTAPFGRETCLRRFAVLMLLILASVPAGHAAAAVAADCTFTFGFKALHDAIPQVVGDCVTNAEPQPNGDVQQFTTGGVLAWRKADNFTAFTDGATTWVLGPYGLQARPNAERFAWEEGGTQSADVESGPDAPYWMRSAHISGVAQDSGGVTVRVEWVGITEVGRLPEGVRAGLIVPFAADTAMVAIRLRIDNTSGDSGTITQLDSANGFAAQHTMLASNLGPINVRDFSDSEGREEVPGGTYRTYEVVFFGDYPAADLESFVLSMPRLRGYRWTPIGESDYRLSFRVAR
jgi:hypothetical protein